jgi:hypothetical protein
MILQKFINELPKPEKAERGNGENDRPHKGNTYNNDENQNVEQSTNPNPIELPDQQKSDEDDGGNTGENDVI